MQKEFLKEITIKLPSDVADTVSIKEIITLLIDKCLSTQTSIFFIKPFWHKFCFR